VRIGAILGLLALCAWTAGAQNVTEPSLKAAFMYNFAKFTVWPPDVLAAAASLTACVVGDSSVFEALRRTVKDRQLLGHGIDVVEIQPQGPIRACHVLYVSGLAPAQVAAILAGIKGIPVLSISDIDDFAKQGGIVQIFLENGRMRFDFNLQAAKASRLQPSSKVLAIAAHVLDPARAAVGP
jgi:hypothetical protein